MLMKWSTFFSVASIFTILIASSLISASSLHALNNEESKSSGVPEFSGSEPIVSPDIPADTVDNVDSTVSALTGYNYASTPIFNLSCDNVMIIASFFDYHPFLALSPVCTFFNSIMMTLKHIRKFEFHSRINRSILRILKDVNRSIQLHRLTQTNPTILNNNEFLDDFLVSDHGLKVMDSSILRYSVVKRIERNNLNTQKIEKKFAENLFKHFIDGQNYDCIESLISIVLDMHGPNLDIDINFNGRNNVLNELVKRNYKRNKELIVFLMKQSKHECFSKTVTGLFNTQATMEDLSYLLKDISQMQILYFMKDSMLEFDLIMIPEEKEFIFSRNQSILAEIYASSSFNSLKNEVDMLELCNIVRYSNVVDNAAIVQKYFSDKKNISYRSNTVATLALLSGNVDLLYRMYQIRNGKKFSADLYRQVSTSQRLMNFLPDEALLNFFETPPERYYFILSSNSFDLTFRLEVISRKTANQRLLEDLNSMFLDDELGKLVAMAFYYPLDLFNDLNGKWELFSAVALKCISYSPKVRNVLNNAVHIVHEILKIITTKLGPEDVSKFKKRIFADIDFIKMLVDPENADIITDMCSHVESVKVDSSLFLELQKDSKFRRNFANPYSSALRLKMRINLRDLFHSNSNLLAHEIVQLLGVLGLEIGDFSFDSLEVLDNTLMAQLVNNPVERVEVFKSLGRLDKLLAICAISNLDNQQSNFNIEFKTNPMLLNSFGVFQLWWERNPDTFEILAPNEIVAAFNARIQR